MQIVKCDDCGNHHRANVECPFCMEKSKPLPPRAPVEGNDSKLLNPDELEALRIQQDIKNAEYPHDEAES